MKYNRSYHPAFAWGYLTVFACLVVMVIAAITGIIPLAWQPLFIFILIGTIIGGGIIAQIGFFKSFDRQAYPIISKVLVIAIITFLVLILFLPRG